MPLTEPLPFNPSPISNPTHPAHLQGARHLGAGLAHLMLGDRGTAAKHLTQAVMHLLTPEHAGAGVAPAPQSAAPARPAAPMKPTKPTKPARATRSSR